MNFKWEPLFEDRHGIVGDFLIWVNKWPLIIEDQVVQENHDFGFRKLIANTCTWSTSKWYKSERWRSLLKPGWIKFCGIREKNWRHVRAPNRPKHLPHRRIGRWSLAFFKRQRCIGNLDTIMEYLVKHWSWVHEMEGSNNQQLLNGPWKHTHTSSREYIREHIK
jgi:hypothetical protein